MDAICNRCRPWTSRVFTGWDGNSTRIIERTTVEGNPQRRKARLVVYEDSCLIFSFYSSTNIGNLRSFHI